MLSGANPPYVATPTFWFLANLGQDESELAAAMQWTDPHLASAIDRPGDGLADGADLRVMLGAWGTAQSDLDGDGTTDGADLGILLGSWGYVCP